MGPLPSLLHRRRRRQRETKPLAKGHTGLVVEPGYLHYVFISTIMSLLCSTYYSVSLLWFPPAVP